MAQYRRKTRDPIGAPSPKKAKRRLDADAPRSAKQSPDEQFLALARERFKQAADADEKQRQRELDDLRFYAGDQWPEDLITARAGQAAVGNLPPVPARPCLTINKVLQPVAQILNQERNMDMGAELIPADDFEGVTGPIDDSEVELREGLLRRIQRAPETADARTWAFERAAIAGRGYWGVMTRYAPGKTWDQDLYVQRFFNQSAVSLDPFHEQPDGSDAEWGFIGNDVPWDVYQAQFPKAADNKDNAVLKACEDDEDFRALGEEYPGWFTLTEKTRICRVVDYYYAERETKTLCLLADGSSMWKDELPKGVEPVDTRDVIEKSIKWAKIDAVQVLERTDWPGPDIPIIKVVGRELQPYDDDRRIEGVVRPMRDSGQGFNYMVSKGVEYLGLTPLPSWQIAEGQDEGFEHEYLLATTRTLPALHYKVRDENGNPYPNIPMRTDVNVPVERLWGAVSLFGQLIQDTTLTPAAAMGEVDPQHKSGKAIQAVIEQSQKGTSNFLDNQARSIRREGQILNGLLYPIYGTRPGRLARIMTGEGETQTILVDQPFHAQDGRPVPATPEGQPGPNLEGAKHYKLTPNANFNIVVKVSKNYDTRRQQEVATLAPIIESNPQAMGVVGDLFFKSLDGPQHNEMAERFKAVLLPPVQQMLAAKAQGGTPPSPELQQAHAQLQQMAQQLQELQGGMAAAQLKAQTDLQIAQLEIQSKERIATMQAQTELAKAGAADQTHRADTIIDAEVQKLKIHADMEKAVLADKGSLRETVAAAQSQDRDHAQEHAMADKGHQQAVQQQALQPQQESM